MNHTQTLDYAIDAARDRAICPSRYGTSIEPSPTVVIEAGHGSPFDLAGLWRYRDLLMFLVWRDVRVRYKQTALGAGWAVIQPLATMAVLSLFFGRLAGLSGDGLPYPLFVLSALLPWTFFANALTLVAGSMVGNESLVTKVYFPRLVIPLSAVGVGVVDFTIAIGAFLGLLTWYGLSPRPELLLLPLFLSVLLLSTVGVGLLLSALTVRYRDLRHVVPLLIQLWFFASPVAYPVSVVPDRFRGLYAFNPLVGVVSAFRAAAAGTTIPWGPLGVSAAVGFVLLLAGVVTFRSVERVFADVI